MRFFSLPLSSLFFLQSLFQIRASPEPNCNDRCGGLPIPYPFGTTAGCFLPGFQLSCTTSFGPNHQIPLLFLPNSTTQITKFSNGQITIKSTQFVATDCANGTRSAAHIALPATGPFTISHNSNKFVAIGCDTVAVISDGGGFTSGCVSLCPSKAVIDTTNCSGVGCCQTAVPEGKRYLVLGATNMYGYKNVSGFENCSYSFVVEKGISVVFGEEHLEEIGMVLDWAIGDGDGCKNTSVLPCGENSNCVGSSRSDGGYLCSCTPGFSGNPYISGPLGCQDVDECVDSDTNPCVDAAYCKNKSPGFECKCPFGSRGDGTKSGSGCRKIFQIVEAVLGTGLGFGSMLLLGLWFYSAKKRRTLLKLKEKYFKQNGGWLLKQQVSSREPNIECARMFTSDELRLATDNFSDSRIIGVGGYGTVYRGTLPNGTTVAIKKSKVIDQTQIDQFINEVVILTQINHRNVVKLLGCCLETEVPLLVYEFVKNGTLFHHLHERRGVSWKQRLRIVTETAEALAYLHSSASLPIIHRDVKSSNVLLDLNFTAKVSDFGISRLVPMDQTFIPTLVQGTLGYLDPEYFQTSQLTAKSDVYSFGVVLVEILTGEKPVSMERLKEQSNLAMYFLTSMKTKEIGEFVDGDVIGDADFGEVKMVASLARKCLLLRGEKRPSMKEVAEGLAAIANGGRRNCGVELAEEGEDEEGVGIVRSELLECVDTQDSLPNELTLDVDFGHVGTTFTHVVQPSHRRGGDDNLQLDSKARGWSYRSECRRYNLHVDCAKEMLVEGWEAMHLNLDKSRRMRGG